MISFKDRLIILDGAMGTTLSAMGLPATPDVNLISPDAVESIHLDYIKTGIDIIEANTFSATELSFSNFEEINVRAIQIAKKAVAKSGRSDVRIAGSIGATGKMVKPVGIMEFEDAVAVFRNQISLLIREGVDLLIIETMDDILEAKAALLAAKECSEEIGIIETMTFSDGERTSTGTPPETAAVVLDSLGADVIGVNCSFGPEGLVNVVRRMRRVTKKPIIAQANAGLPRFENRKTVYPVDPVRYAELAEKLVEAGASYIGGCCGTDKGHIEALVKKFRDRKPVQIPETVPLIISSRSKWVEFGDAPVIIGERINFIANKELRNSDSGIIRECIKQHDAGADAVDVNLGSDENRAVEVIDLISGKTDIPVVLDCQTPEHVEKVARRYPGLMLLNSISGENEKMEKLLPIAKKYGLPFVGLCVDDKGIKKEVKTKLQLADKIIEKAAGYGIESTKIIIDPLTLSVSTDVSASLNTLKAIEKIENHTILGISNISSGMPQRALLNQTFSALAVRAGCSALIVNPLDAELIYSLFSSSLLSARDPEAKRYLRYFSSAEKQIEFDNPLEQAIFEGDNEKAESIVVELLETQNGTEIVNNYIIPSLKRVGKFFNNRKIFLPQLISSAQTVQNIMRIIQEKITREGGIVTKKSRILIATVKGDIHDIGKNLVSLILENHSYEVKDMGVDVDSKEIVKEALSWGADVIALSSLMTITMANMQEVIDILKEKSVTLPVIIGGAAISKKYAESIGALYGKDAIDAVQTISELTGK
ncbi:homocysteine S-methyltransferase family protein [Elusimicrobiota bacterium]